MSDELPERPEDHPHRASIDQSVAFLHWIHSQLDGLKVRGLGNSKRMAFAAGCWHVGFEHSGSIILLTEEGQYASALALMRPLFESYLRGMWLLHAASDTEVDDAGRDRFPNDINRIIRDLEAKGYSFRFVQGEAWKHLCSLTHTGYRQIGCRLTPDGLGYACDKDQVQQALAWATGIALMILIAFAQLAGNSKLAEDTLAMMREWGAPTP